MHRQQLAAKLDTIGKAMALGWPSNQAYLSSCRSVSHTLHAVLLGVKARATRTRKSEAWRSNIEEARVVPNWKYIRPAMAGRSY